MDENTVPEQDFLSTYNKNGIILAGVNDFQNPAQSLPSVYNAVSDPIAPQSIGNGYIANDMYSSNFATGVSGWRLSYKGDFEANSGTFRGQVKIGGLIVNVKTTDDIQTAINTVNAAGGGRVILANGTHTQNSNITMYSNISLEGENELSAIIDFNNGSFGINAVGSNVYNTGTVTVTKGSTAIVGSGTTWTQSMLGQNILLSGIWYPIVAFVNAGQVAVGFPFADTTALGQSYTIATTINDVQVMNLTIKNSTTNAININYGNNYIIQDLILVNNTVGTSVQNSSSFALQVIDASGCGKGADLNNCYNGNVTAFSCIDSTNMGFNITKSQFIDFGVMNITNSTNNGVSLTSCSILSFNQFASRNNGAAGMEMVSGNSSINIGNSVFNNNGTDGLKITDSSSMGSAVNSDFANNSGWGVNIVSANCNNNIILVPQFTSNGSGDITDSGTGTNIIYPSGRNVSIGTTSANIAGNNSANNVLTVKGFTASGFLELATAAGDVSGTRIGGLDFVNGSNTSGKEMAFVEAVSTGATAGNRGANLNFYIKPNGGALAKVMVLGSTGGLQLGAPTGGDTGTGTLNVATNIFLNNTAYTNPDYALEHWVKGSIEKFKDNKGAKEYKRMLLKDIETYVKENLRLPRITDETMGVVERFDILLEKVEEIYTFLFEINKKLNLEL